ncbi:MAG: hypothetical protein C0174_05490 [Thermodesulfobium narugense]|nr:MAG: hypothetical protein C0174_05490 [Thermodesulfobium narugense]
MFFIIIFFLLSLSSKIGYTGALDMKEGLWEITTIIEEESMSTEMFKTTYKHCLTKRDFIPQRGTRYKM